MIRINLLGETKDKTALYILQMIVFGFALVVTAVACVIVQNSFSSKVAATENEKSLLDAQLVKLKQKTKKVEELEKNKKFLGEKLTTIAKLKAKRQGPVQLLSSITTAIPERAWLTDIIQSGEEIQFQGLSIDPQTVSTFMRDLQASVFFKSVDLTYSRQFLRDGVKLQKFEVTGKLQDAIALQAKLLEMETGGTVSADAPPEAAKSE